MNHWKKTISGMLILSLLITILSLTVSAAPEEKEFDVLMLDEYTLEVIGLPDDLVNPVADVCYEERVDNKRVITYVAEDVPVIDGVLEINGDEPLVFEKEYTLLIYNDETDDVIELDFVLSEEEEIIDVPKFDDVPYPCWYSGFLEYCVAKGLVSGIGGNRFGPNQKVTRAQVAQILYALNGKPQVTVSGSFTDVPDGKWFSDAINWAAEKKIMAGYVTGQFQPESAITRQQFMATLYKYARMKSYDSTRSGNIETYEDAQSITEYAVPAMQWAVGHGVMTGSDKNRLMPKETTTRDQMVAILASFDRNVVKKT